MTADTLESQWAREEWKVHHAPDLPHERILFSAHRVHVDADALKISAKDYYSDAEFKTIYTILRKKQDHAAKALKHAKTVSKIKTVHIVFLIFLLFVGFSLDFHVMI